MPHCMKLSLNNFSSQNGRSARQVIRNVQYLFNEFHANHSRSQTHNSTTNHTISHPQYTDPNLNTKSVLCTNNSESEIETLPHYFSSHIPIYKANHNFQPMRNFHSSLPKKDIYIINNEEEFEDKVMRSKLPVVINFHADWCEPCHALKPLLENLAEKFKGRMHLAEVSHNPI